MNQQESNEYRTLYPNIFQVFSQTTPQGLERIVERSEGKVEREEVTRDQVLYALHKGSELVQPSMGTSKNIFM